jgi:hypothetical protein
MAALSPDRRRVVLYSLRTRRFTLRDVETGSVLVQSPPTGENRIVASSNLKFVASRGESHSSPGSTIAVTIIDTEAMRNSSGAVSYFYWDLPENRVRRAASDKAWDPAQADSFSPDGRLAATPTGWRGEHLAVLRDARTGRSVRRLD